VKKNGIVITTVGPVDEEEAKQYGVRVEHFVMKRNSEELEQIGKLLDQGAIKPRISTIMPLSEARKADDLSQSGHPHGKVVLRVA
jgi:NADPH:quinone reductase-like Zn-dependent oxidoreductase